VILVRLLRKETTGCLQVTCTVRLPTFDTITSFGEGGGTGIFKMIQFDMVHRKTKEYLKSRCVKI